MNRNIKSKENASFLDVAAFTLLMGPLKEKAMIDTLGVNNNILQLPHVNNDEYISEAQLVNRYGETVYRFCLGLVNHKEDADDLFQDTYLRAFTEIDKIKMSENPQSFLLSIAASLWKSHKRKYSQRNSLAPEVELNEAYVNDISDPEDEVLAREEVLIVRKLVYSLPVKYKIPIILYYTVGMSISDIVEALNLPEGIIKSHLSRGHEIIRKGLINEYGNE